MKQFAARTSKYGWFAFALPIFSFLLIKGGLGWVFFGLISALLVVSFRIWFWYYYKSDDYLESYCQNHDRKKKRAFFMRGDYKIYYSYCEECQKEEAA